MPHMDLIMIKSKNKAANTVKTPSPAPLNTERPASNASANSAATNFSSSSIAQRMKASIATVTAAFGRKPSSMRGSIVSDYIEKTREARTESESDLSTSTHSVTHSTVTTPDQYPMEIIDIPELNLNEELLPAIYFSAMQAPKILATSSADNEKLLNKDTVAAPQQLTIDLATYKRDDFRHIERYAYGSARDFAASFDEPIDELAENMHKCAPSQHDSATHVPTILEASADKAELAAKYTAAKQDTNNLIFFKRDNVLHNFKFNLYEHVPARGDNEAFATFAQRMSECEHSQYGIAQGEELGKLLDTGEKPMESVAHFKERMEKMNVNLLVDTDEAKKKISTETAVISVMPKPRKPAM